MAVTNIKRRTDYTSQNQGASSGSGMSGVSSSTQNQQAKYQNSYTPSQNVTQAQTQLQQAQASKPADYQSKYGAQLDSILAQIQNPEKFNYTFNGDELFKQYADLYAQKGKQASMDAMGQAASLTGGYGNSYAQAVGNQQYNQYLMDLYDKGMDMYDRAYQRYTDQNADLYNQLGALNTADQTEYSRYTDQLNQWNTDRDYASQQEQLAYNREYDQYVTDRDYWNQQAQLENQDYWTQQQMAENQYQYDTGLEEQQRQYDQSMAENQRQYDTSLSEEQRQYDSTMAENQRQYDTNMAENQRQYDQSMAENQRQYDTGLAEEQRQFDASMQQDMEQFNATSELNWAQLQQDQNQFEASLTEEQRQYNRSIAVDYVASILANGQIPSNDLLVAAGLSLEDAQKLIAEVTTGGVNPDQNPDKDDTGSGNDKLNGLSFKDASILTELNPTAIASDPNKYDAYIRAYANAQKKTETDATKAAENATKVSTNQNATNAMYDYLKKKSITGK